MFPASLVAGVVFGLTHAFTFPHADCRMSVWIVQEVPEEIYQTACVGSCEDPGDLCEQKSQVINGKTYLYCKCTHDGTPVEPDSTACTTVVTHVGGEQWAHYCYDQACETYCVEFYVRWQPTAPCGCH